MKNHDPFPVYCPKSYFFTSLYRTIGIASALAHVKLRNSQA
jgi:hypothetical protein